MTQNEWDKIDFNDKWKILGNKGEMYVYNQLLQNYPKKNYLILNLHSFCELDWVVIDKEKEEIINIYEVKTTTKDKKEFGAGSQFQLRVFKLQQIKKEKKLKFIPCYLYVLRVDNKFWLTGNFEVISEEIYPIDKIKINLEKQLWKVS